MDQKLLHEREAKCVQENPPGCTAGCPVHVDARGLIAAVRKGDLAAGLALYAKTIPFPGIISRICDQPCRQACKRREVDESLSVRALERFCAEKGGQPASRPTPPAKNQHVAVVGAGLSGLTAALDLAHKGYRVTVYEASDRMGGRICELPESELPRRVIDEDFAVFKRLPVEVNFNTPVGADTGLTLAGIAEKFDAVYLGVGRRGASSAAQGLETDDSGKIIVDQLTMATSSPKVFAGGSLLRSDDRFSPIDSLADGRSAAISIDRLLQNASLTAGREKAGPYASKLYTSIDGVKPQAAVSPAEPAGGYSESEAAAEAGRCLACECRECVKVCEYLAHYGAYPKRYVREVYNNLSIVMGIHHANKMINTCSLCGLCREVCPGQLDMGEICAEARRMMVARGKMPPSAHDFAIKDMHFSGGDDFTLSRHQPGFTTSSLVFYPGCQQAASSPDSIRRMYEYLCEKVAGGVGLMLGCCGAPANWAGQQDLFQETLAKTEKEWRSLGSPPVVTACPTCYSMFHHNLPAMKLEPLWTLLDRIGLPPGVNSENKKARRLAVHDSCTTRHEAGLQESVRSLLGKLGFEAEELARTRERTVCCGYGGLMIFANPEVAQKEIGRRINESESDYLTYCAMCRDNFASRGKRAFYLMDLLFSADVEGLATRTVPGYSQRRENRARLKRSLLRELWHESAAEPLPEIKVNIPDDVLRIMEDRMILVSDVTKVIAHAESTGNKLKDTATGHYLAYFRPVAVTYWVEYSPQGDGFVVHNAYSHRIEILEQ